MEAIPWTLWATGLRDPHEKGIGVSFHDWQVYNHPDDLFPFDLDLGCGTIPKAKMGIDRFPTPEVPDLIVMDLDRKDVRLPFSDGTLSGIITHHCFEHLLEGYLPVVDECWRVLREGGLLRIIVPLFPGKSAWEDPDHKRVFQKDSFLCFGGTPGDGPENCWLAGFSVPYTKARFDVDEPQCTPIDPDTSVWEQVRELRVSMRARKS